MGNSISPEKEEIHPDTNWLRVKRQTVMGGRMHMIYSLIPSAAAFLGHIKEQYRTMLAIPLTYKNFIIECSRHLSV